MHGSVSPGVRVYRTSTAGDALYASPVGVASLFPLFLNVNVLLALDSPSGVESHADSRKLLLHGSRVHVLMLT